MATLFTLKEIQHQTGLKERFLRRCMDGLKDIFDPYITRGENNAILFNDSALVLFDRIKQLKEDDLTIPEIRRRLGYRALDKPGEESGETSGQRLVEVSDKVVKPDEERSVNQFYERLLEEREKTHEAELEARGYKVQLEAKQALIDVLQSKLQLLTDGRDPEEVRKAEEKEKRRHKKEILDRLEELEGRWFKGRERKELIKRLREIDEG
jgi:hypothetical protein